MGLCPTVFSQGQLDWITVTHNLTLTCVKICFHYNYAEVPGGGGGGGGLGFQYVSWERQLSSSDSPPFLMCSWPLEVPSLPHTPAPTPEVSFHSMGPCVF